MSKNVGTLDAYIRLTVGFTLLSYGIIRGSKIPIIMGASKVAEGITRWCPMLYLLGMSTKEDVEFTIPE